MTSKLNKAYKEFDQGLAKKDVTIFGSLGILIDGKRTVEVVNRPSFVYVKLRNSTSELIQAFNAAVSPSYGLPVKIARRNNRYEIIGRDEQRYGSWASNSSFIPNHGNTHTYSSVAGGGTDVVWVDGRQFLPARVVPSNSLNLGADNVTILPTPVKGLDGHWGYYGGTGTQSLRSFWPTSGTSLVLVSLDTVSGNPHLLATTGSYIPSSTTGMHQLLQYLPRNDNPRYIPTAFVRLESGTNNVAWDNIYDIRQFMQVVPTGSSGGGTIYAQDEGGTRSAVDTFNFVGSYVTASVSGTVARVEVSVSGVITTGSSVPTSPNAGAAHYHNPTGRKVLLQYDGTNWNPIISYGAMTLYVDGTNGTDTINNGFSSGTNAFASLQYAINAIPPKYDTVSIFITTTGSYTAPTIYGKYSYSGGGISIQGTLSPPIESLTASAGVKGSAATKGSVTRNAGTWTVSARAKKILKFTSGANLNLFRIIYDNTNTVATIVGTYDDGAAPAANDTFDVLDWGTVITGSLDVADGCNVTFKYIKFTGARDIYQYAQTTFETCWFTSTAQIRRFGIATHTTCLFETSGNAVYARNNAIVGQVKWSYFSGTGSKAGRAVRLENCCSGNAILGSVIDNFADGIRCDLSSTMDESQTSATGYNFISNCTNGLLAQTGGKIITTTNNQYTGNTTNENADATSYGYID